MKQYIFLIITTFISFSALGQHCQWDGSAIIIVEVRDSLTDQIVNGLELVLADSTGKPYISEDTSKDYKFVTLYQNTDTLRFGQNTKREDQEFHKYHGPFPFAVDSYMLILNAYNYPKRNDIGKDMIIIKDFDGTDNLGFFKTTKINISQNNICINKN